jgi:hypothetical protein
MASYKFYFANNNIENVLINYDRYLDKRYNLIISKKKQEEEKKKKLEEKMKEYLEQFKNK